MWHKEVKFAHPESGTVLSSEASFADDIMTFRSWVQGPGTKAPSAALAVQVFDFVQAHSCSNCAPGV